MIPSTPHPAPAEGVEKWWALLADFRLLLLRYWWIPALGALLGAALQIALSTHRPITYSSVARLVVSGKLALPQDISYSEEAMNFFGTQIEMIKSPEVRARAAEIVRSLHPELAASPVDLNIAQMPKTSIFFLQAVGAEPRYVAAYLDAVLQAYIAARKSIFAEKSNRALSVITDELTRQEEQLRQSENALFEWQRKNNLVSLREEDNSAGSYLAILNRRLAHLQTEHRLLQTLSLDQNLDRIAPGNPEPDGALADAPAGDDTPPPPGAAADYLQARQALVLLQARLALARVDHQDNHPAVDAILKEIDLHSRRVKFLQQQSTEQLTSRRDAIRIQIENTQAEILDWQKRAVDLSERLGEADRLKSKVDRQKELYNRLLSNLQSVDVGSNIQQDIVSVLDRASPAQTLRPNYAAAGAKGALGGLFLGGLLLFVLRGLDDRVTSLARLTERLSVPVAGIIPRAETARGWLRRDDDRSAFREAFRNLRSWLQFQSADALPSHCLLITSAVPDEGKSTVAANLAVALSWSGSRVLLVDADFRRGALHVPTGLDPTPGLAEVLTGEVSFDETVRCLEPDHLYLLPRGNAFRHGLDAVRKGALERFLETARRDYDWVILDASPLLAADDACNLAPLVDGCLVVVRSRFSSHRLTARALPLLESRHATVLGVVYNACADALDYPYYRYAAYTDTAAAS